MRRQVVARGVSHCIEYGVAADGSHPAAEVLEQMATGEWTEDFEAEGLPDEAQIGDYDRFLTICQDMAECGYPERMHDVNCLQGGVWEWRRSSKRVSWYDTPGDGTSENKRKYTDRSESEFPDDEEFWRLPRFDYHIRLLHVFMKTGQKTAPAEISTAIRLKEEDLTHDRV